MKPVAILRILFLAVQVFSVSSHKTTQWPDEGVMKWNIDLNDMMRLKKSIIKGDAEVESNEMQETIPLEYQLEMYREQIEILKKLTKLQNQTKQYIKRYINLFLVKCSLQNVPESDEDLKVDLEFSITKEDLIFLQNLSKDISLQNVQDNLYKLDKIFDKGLMAKEEKIYTKTWLFILNLLQSLNIPSSWYFSKLFYYVVVLSVTLILAICFKCFGLSNLIIVLTVINNWILLEGVLSYLNQLKEAETVDHVMSLKAMSYSDACDPMKQTIWSKITEWFTGDKCLNYHMTFVNSKTQEVSPLKCILDAYNMYLFQYFFKIFGSGIRIFTENLYDGMPMRGVWVLLSYTWIVPFILGLVFIVLKPSIRFSFFGAGISIGFPQLRLTSRRNEDEPIEYQKVQEIETSEGRDTAAERTERALESDSQTKASVSKDSICDKPVECIREESHSKLAAIEKSGNVGESNRTLLEDITTARNIVNDIKKNQ